MEIRCQCKSGRPRERTSEVAEAVELRAGAQCRCVDVVVRDCGALIGMVLTPSERPAVNTGIIGDLNAGAVEDEDRTKMLFAARRDAFSLTLTRTPSWRISTLRRSSGA